MPQINRYLCNQCSLELPTGWGGHTYAVNASGERIVCPRPAEGGTIRQVTGLSWTEANKADLAGYAQYCICSACLKQFELDLDRDARVCPSCASSDVHSVRESVGRPCPRCKAGLIEEVSPIRLKLDPDWEQLPVPQIVKDLVLSEQSATIPESLRPAAAAVGGLTLDVVTRKLLGWWEGRWWSKDRRQQDFAVIQSEALPAILLATPPLAEIVVIREGRCWFAEGVSSDVRRGIKNYLYKHRKHVIQC